MKVLGFGVRPPTALRRHIERVPNVDPLVCLELIEQILAEDVFGGTVGKEDLDAHLRGRVCGEGVWGGCVGRVRGERVWGEGV